IRAEAVSEAKAVVDARALVYQVQVMSAMRERWVAEEATVIQIRVEENRQVVASAPHELGRKHVEITDEPDHVNHRLGREPADGGRTDVMDRHAGQQRGQPFALGDIGVAPGAVVSNDLDWPFA